MLFGAVGNFISFSIFVAGAMLLFKKFDIGPFEIGNYLSIGIIFSATDSVCTLQVYKENLWASNI